jgi:tRNA (cmo5U34)-methyltransferase
MSDTAVAAYELPKRLASYDADMQLMHPNRDRMVALALDLLPQSRDAKIRALDLGTGTGYVASKFLDRFPSATLVGIDGSDGMLRLAETRLAAFAGRFELARGDFRDIRAAVNGSARFDVVLSAFALHHVNRADKTAVVKQCLSVLRAGGWFLNADLVRSKSDVLEERIQTLRVAGIVARNAGKDARFKDADATRAYLDNLEREDGDQPLSIEEDLAVLKDAGLGNSGVFWLETREAVTGGVTQTQSTVSRAR